MDFTFKQFHIEQDKCAMKVGTDGVLLGSWAMGGKNILDIPEKSEKNQPLRYIKNSVNVYSLKSIALWMC